ncbi:MAG: carbohydrate-binding domain-containing protein [Lachnospiraceae bacterium]|nr:carbohydrate-binding domain-containing protein [Lachnospiraceae bacterium]
MKSQKVRCATLLMAGIFLLSGCQEILDAQIGTAVAAESDAAAVVDVSRYEITSSDYETEGADYIEIDLEQNERKSGITEQSSALYSWNGQQLKISQAGDYVLNGSLDGSVTVSVCNDEVVHLILNNVEIHSQSGPAIYVEKAAKVILTAADGTENTISDTVVYDEDNQACIFSNVDLTINGSGVLNVYGYHEDAIRSKDLLKVINTNLFVKANNDGLRGNDGVIVFNSDTSIESEGTGIRSVSDKDMVMIQGGICKVIAGENAVAANRHVSIHDSQADLYSVEETVKCSGIRDIEEGILS